MGAVPFSWLSDLLLAFSGLAGIINFYLEPEKYRKINRKSPFSPDLLFFVKWRARAGACSWLTVPIM